MAMGQGTLVPDAGEVVLDQMMAEGRSGLVMVFRPAGEWSVCPGCRRPWRFIKCVEEPLLLRHITPLTRHNSVYFCSAAQTSVNWQRSHGLQIAALCFCRQFRMRISSPVRARCCAPRLMRHK